MANFNKIMLMGNLTRDPELSYLPNNTPVVKLGLAVNRRFKRQDGEQGEETLFVDCNAFGRQAEVINQYLRKGRGVFIEGRLRLERWQDKDGNNRSKHTVIIENFQFMGGRDDNDGDSGGGGGGYSGRSSAPSRSAPPAHDVDHGPGPGGPNMDDADIPF